MLVCSTFHTIIRNKANVTQDNDINDYRQTIETGRETIPQSKQAL